MSAVTGTTVLPRHAEQVSAVHQAGIGGDDAAGTV